MPDLSTGKSLNEGSLSKNMLGLLIPLLASNLLNSLYNIIDGVWIGQLLGTQGVAAVNSVYPVISASIGIATSFAIAASVLISREYGSGDHTHINIKANSAYAVILAASILSTILLISVSSPLLTLLKTPAEIRLDTHRYYIVYMLGFFLNFLLMGISEMIRATGNSKWPMHFALVGTALNIILDPILITSGLGVVGAGWATCISMAIATTYAIITLQRKSALLRISPKLIRFNGKVTRQMLSLALPLMIQEIFSASVLAFEVTVSNMGGVLGSATYGVVSKLEQVSIITASSFRSIISVTVGQFIGARSYERLGKIARTSILFLIIPMTLIGTVAFVFPETFSRIFINEPAVIAQAVSYLAIVGWAQLLMQPVVSSDGFLLGASRSRLTLLSTIVASVVEISMLYGLVWHTEINNLHAIGFSLIAYMVVKLIINSISIRFEIKHRYPSLKSL